jgi:RimJ/RimL family protein N-acetyltransferase
VVTNFATMQSERLTLTAISLGDLAEFHALHSDPAVYEHAPEARHPDLAYSESVIGTYVDDWSRWGLGYWTVRSRQDAGSYLGCAGVRRNEVNWNIYYRFVPAGWGHGYAAEVIRVAAACAEAVEPGAQLQAVMRPWNPASRRVAEKLGLVFCGEQLDHDGVAELVYQGAAADLA